MKHCKICLFACLAVFSMFSCNDEFESESGVIFHFFPRKCNFLWVIPAENVKKTSEYGDFYELEQLTPGKSIAAQDLRLLVHTSNLDTLPEYYDHVNLPTYQFHQCSCMENLWDLDEGNQVLEDQLEQDYLNSIDNSSATKSASSIGSYLKPYEYRTTGVTQFMITANKTLFGQEPGESLNDFFEIADLEPRQIISAVRSELVFGYSDWTGDMSIGQWLGFEPTAQPTMKLRMNQTPVELPLTVVFSIKITSSHLNIVEVSQPIDLGL